VASSRSAPASAPAFAPFRLHRPGCLGRRLADVLPPFYSGKYFAAAVVLLMTALGGCFVAMVGQSGGCFATLVVLRTFAFLTL
jgi:hypothetical protein